MNFLEFLEHKSHTARVNESFSTNQLDIVHDLMLGIFRKKISKKVMSWGWLNTVIDGQEMKSYYFIDINGVSEPKLWALNYLVSDSSSSVYSISFYDVEASKKMLWGDSNTIKATTYISTLGTSVAYFIPIICHIVNNGDYGLSKEAAMKMGSEIFNKGRKDECRIFNYGAAKYRIYDNFNEDDAYTVFHIKQGYTLVNEASEAQDYRWKKKAERDAAMLKFKTTKSTADKEEFDRIQSEYQDVVNAIRGGAQTLEDINMMISSGKVVSLVTEPSTYEAEQKFKKASKTPDQAFKEMSVYVKTVIKGLQPGVILCGAPGIGKTYRILQQLKAAGYYDGHNMEIIKGKCTPRQLYLSLYEYQDKGKIVVIDDADALVGPKAPEDCINMLKAALDSTSTENGRKVSYRVSGKILDDDGNEIPKTLYYNGGVIVITNYSIGQIDTALRGRTFIQSLDFSTEQLLGIIEDIMPAIDPARLSMKSKEKALNYLKELASNGSSMEISIRSFSTCAKLFAVCEGDNTLTDDDVKSMIKEQTENMALRGGSKF